MNILDINNLNIEFKDKHSSKMTKVVEDVSFTVKKGEIFAIVGESGSGKSVTCYSLLGILPNSAVISGNALFKGKDLYALNEKEFRKIRGNKLSIIFQEPMTSLNPYLTIGYQITEPLIAHTKISSKEAKATAIDLLNKIGIKNPTERFSQYPHEFSGGMRQRIMIAMALITKPDLLIADEPTTALDVTVQTQILKLLVKLRDNFEMGVILVTHDLGIVAEIADRVAVMYCGKILEIGNVEDIFYGSKHPYTISLKKALPLITEKNKERLYTIPGIPPESGTKKGECPFADRCYMMKNNCKSTYKHSLYKITETHSSSCIFFHEI